METLFQLKWSIVLLELLLKSSVILSLALGFYFFARKQPASVRHFVLGISLLSLLVLPFLSVFMPGWQTNLLPSWTSDPNESETVTIVQFSTPLANPESKNLYQLQAHLPVGDHAAGFYSFFQPQFRIGVITLWFLVCSFMLVKILFGLYGAFRLTRQGISMKGYPWQQLFLWFLEKMSLKRNVRLIKNQRVSVPMTWGILKPVILMPPASTEWPVEHCSSVLFHELSHVKRGDFLMLLLCRIACSLYWLNPLSWFAFKLLRKEQEKACDEMVLKTGIKPSTYASALLRLKKAVDKGHYMPSPAVGMAGNSELNERLTTILEKKFKTKEIKMKTKLILLLLIFLTITFIATAKPEQTAAKSEQTVLAKYPGPGEKPKIAGEEKGTDHVKCICKCSDKCSEMCQCKCCDKCIHKCCDKCCEKCQCNCCAKCSHKSSEKCCEKCQCNCQCNCCAKCPYKGNEKCSAKCSEKCIHICREKGKNICIMRCKGLKNTDTKNDKEKKIVVIVEDEENDKGEDKEVEKIIICKHHADKKDIEKDIEKDIKEIEKEGGKEGKCCKHILICCDKKGKDAGPEIVKIQEGKDGNIEKDIICIKKCAGEGKSFKMEFSSENKMSSELLDKVSVLVKTLHEKLPSSYKVTSELDESQQKIIIDCPIIKSESETCETSQKFIDEFEKEFKNLLPAIDGKKTLQKKIFIKKEVKEEKEEA